LPEARETCGNNADDDCDGRIDEGCPCNEGAALKCYTGPAGTEGRGLCSAGYQHCAGGTWGDCLGEVKPAAESCNGVPEGRPPADADCDGKPDLNVTGRCGLCGEAKEVCGNGLDDDCDGVIDDGCDCQADCLCDGAPDCTCRPRIGQPCYDGPAGTAGRGICKSGTHDCLLNGGSWQWTACAGEVLPQKAETCGNGLDDDCNGLPDDGCAPSVECAEWETAACYTGYPGTRNVGICRDGTRRCAGGAWESACAGEALPQPAEICGDGLDNNCNGKIDEGCTCDGKIEQECWPGPEDSIFGGTSICRKGRMVCLNGESWGACASFVIPTIEVCGDALDNDCDGAVDDGCVCANGWKRSCYTGDPATRHAGACSDGLETCVEGRWSGVCDGQVLPAYEPCGSATDIDCDGLTGGPLNACGKCGEPCYTEDYDKPSDCSKTGRKCNGTEPDPNNPDAVTLGQATSSTPFIYVAVYEKNEVAKLDTATGAKLWQKPSYGLNPSRTAVAYDYSVWVGNRGNMSNPSDPANNDPSKSNAVHLDLDGNLICRADVPGICRGVAIDADGFVYAGTYNTKKIYKIHPTNVDALQSPPRCQIVNVYDVGKAVYGLAVDGKGYLWSSSPESAVNSTVKLNTLNGTFINDVPNPSSYGIAISPKDGRLWFGNYYRGSGVSAQCVHSILPDPPYTSFMTKVGCGGIITGVTVDHEGYVWASSYTTGYVFKIDPNTGDQVCTALSPCQPGGTSGCDARGVAEDSAGKIWVVNRSGGYANRFTRNCVLENTFPVDPGYANYTYSDMTGQQLRTVTTKEGYWVQDFDSGYSSPIWHKAEWTAYVPADTGVDVSFKSADTAGGLQNPSLKICGPYNAPPADLVTDCPFLSGRRWIQADVRLWSRKDGSRPSFSGLKLYWARP
jgi:hypothetical protein